MVQDQLVEYIKTQLKLGVSRDAVKAALIGAGWVAADVDETLKKVEGESKPAAPVSSMPSSMPVASVAAKPATSSFTASSTAPASFSKPAASSPISSSPVVLGVQGVTQTSAANGMPITSKPAETRSVKISDLVSAGAASTASISGVAAKPAATATATVEKPAAPKTDFFKSFGKGGSTQPNIVGGGVAMPTHRGGGKVVVIIFGVLALGFACAAGYFYYQNATLSGKIASLGSQSADVEGRLATLNTEMQALDATNTALTAQVDTLNNDKTALETNLSFVALPVGASTAASDVNVSGTLKVQKGGYVLTTSYGVAVFVKNSTDPGVDAALKPLLTTATSSPTVTLAGSHVPGSAFLTVTSVNGTAIATPAPPAPAAAGGGGIQ